MDMTNMRAQRKPEPGEETFGEVGVFEGFSGIRLVDPSKLLKHRGRWHVVWETICDPDRWEDGADVRIHPDYFWRAKA